jgi:phage gp46-like protein
MIALALDPAALTADAVRDPASGALAAADTPAARLHTLALGLLLTDRWAEPGERLPDADAPRPSGDRRGWWGDALAEEEGFRLGSRLWLRVREKASEATRRQIVADVEEALRPLIDRGLAVAVAVEAAWNAVNRHRLDLRIRIAAPQEGPAAELALAVLAEAA